MKAVVFIDVQNDFVKGGKLSFGYPIEDNIQNVIEFAKHCIADTDCKIYATRDTHEATKWIEKNCAQVVVGYLATLEGQKLPVEHCIEGTSGWMIDNRLMNVFFAGFAKDEAGVEDKEHPVYNCTFINKPTFGSYDLVDIIAEDFETAPDEIVLCGYDLGVCVISNAVLLRAKYPNVKITIKKDLCGCINKETFNAALCVAKCCQIDIE